MRAALALAGALTGLLSSGCSPCAPVAFGPADGPPVLELCVDVAVTAVERRTGLRGAPEPAEGTGLMLQFPGEGTVCLDNEAVAFDLDAIYVNDEERVVLVRRLAAGDATSVCETGVRRVVELAAGGAAEVASGSHVMTLPRRYD